MELDSQERKRQNATLYNFTVKSSLLPLRTEYSLVTQKWLVERTERKQDTVNGIGPMGLVRNKIPLAAYKQPRVITRGEENEEEESGCLLLSGGLSRNILIRDWLDHTKIKDALAKPFTEKDLKID